MICGISIGFSNQYFVTCKGSEIEITDEIKNCFSRFMQQKGDSTTVPHKIENA